MTEEWWGRKERLEYELRELDEAGFSYEPMDLESAGPTNLIVHVEIDGEGHDLEVTFPELYPFFRFLVRAPKLELDYHIAPDGTLCLIGRDAGAWRLSDTLAAYLTERLDEVVRAGRATSREEVADLEEHQAEPYSDYFGYSQTGMVLIDGSWEIPEGVVAGVLVLGYTPIPGHPSVQAAVLELRTESGEVIGSLDSTLARRYTRTVEASWAWSADRPPLDPPDFASFVGSRADHLRGRDWIEFGEGRQRFMAVTFPEQSAWRETNGTGWVFLTEVKAPTPKGRLGLPQRAFLRAGRVGPSDFLARAPELEGLRSKKIAQCGLGCIGAPSALGFARGGIGRLAVVDGDHVDPGTALRWPHGLHVSGHRKTQVIANQIRSDYPYTTVEPIDQDLGFIGNGNGRIPSDLQVLETALQEADLIYDATANVSVQYLLSEYARRLRIPYVEVWGAQGGWGGVVVRIRPDETGCWTCLQQHQQDWSDSDGVEGIPLPPSKADGVLQPQGCGTPTFMAAGFDMETIATTGVRGAVELLSNYPRANWDVLVIRLRSADGDPLPPTYEAFPLEPHPECQRCGAGT